MKVISTPIPTTLDLLEDLDTIRAGVNALYVLKMTNPEEIIEETAVMSAFDYVYDHLSNDITNTINKAKQKLSTEKEAAQ